MTKKYKQSRSMLFIAWSVSVLLTGCGFQEIENLETEPEIHIATIPVQTEQKENTAPESGKAESLENRENSENSENSEQNPDSDSDPNPEEAFETESETEPEVIPYSDYDFEKAIFAALLDGLCCNTAMPSFVMADTDRDHYAEFMISIPISETSSQNVVLESPASSGVYYYDATGIRNDFFVIDPEQNQVFLNENTRSEENPDSIISREYFKWAGNQWETVSLLYGNHCYWNNANVSTDEFYANAEKLVELSGSEDVFNIYLTNAELKEVTNAFYEYLSRYYQPSKPIAADINGDGMSEQIISVQNLSKNWVSNLHNLYETDGVLDVTGLNAMHTTCFVLDYIGENVRIRSENFDRRYTFSQSSGMLFAQDDTNAMQTIQYTNHADGLGEHFMSVMWG
ncbi:MAG: hypothetical protein K2H82_08760 [Oscillospiraceae bacterium]|nr:hypothetical protein [Oscillospiraceae bacterium]